MLSIREWPGQVVYLTFLVHFQTKIEKNVESPLLNLTNDFRTNPKSHLFKWAINKVFSSSNCWDLEFLTDRETSLVSTIGKLLLLFKSALKSSRLHSFCLSVGHSLFSDWTDLLWLDHKFDHKNHSTCAVDFYLQEKWKKEWKYTL